MYEYEQEAYAQGFRTVCGVDEAGRGPLAGDVYAAAVILPQGLEIPGIDDSKKLAGFLDGNAVDSDPLCPVPL